MPMNDNYSEEDIYRILQNGSDEDRRKIVDHLFSGADGGNADFANIAADWLRYGRHGVEIDIERSKKYLATAVEALIPDAIYDYAMSLDGDEEKEKRSAFNYYILAAILGDVDAIDAVSEFFLYGDVTGNDDFISGALRKHAIHLRSGSSG
jgi:TPR repeat protein